jgi:hypothetical protein
MRSALVRGLLVALSASAGAATLRHLGMKHRLFISPDVASSFAAMPDWDHERSPPSVHYDGTPGYNDPSKFGGSTALPIPN